MATAEILPTQDSWPVQLTLSVGVGQDAQSEGYTGSTCERSMEVAGWKYVTTNEPQPEIPVLFFSFFDVICERPLVLPLTFSCSLTTSLSDVQNKNT